MKFLVLLFINLLFLSGPQSKSPSADSLVDDEAAIAPNIKALHDQDSETREAAAEALRRIIAKYPSDTSNIRSKDGGEAGWRERISQLKESMTLTEVTKILPPSPESTGYEIAPSGDVSYRLDNDWIVTI